MNDFLNACMKPFTVQNLIDEILSDKIKRIVVMTGAGISTASGIPDFRSSQTGLYNNLEQYNIPYPEAIFEKSYFRRNPVPFFRLAKELMPNIEKYKPNKIHYFIRLLQDKKILHRLYTQNIDGLESLTGIESKKIVEAHGSFRSAHCIKCNCLYSGLYVKNEIELNQLPVCIKHKCNGIVKPDITFFGENLPDNFYELHESDFLIADFILVMGTSLQVEPFANIIKKSRSNVPRLLLNKESVGPFKLISLKNALTKDLQILGDLTTCVDFLVEKLGWKQELDELINKETKFIENIKENLLEKMFFINIDNRLIRSEKSRPVSRATSKTRLDRRNDSNNSLLDVKIVSLNDISKSFNQNRTKNFNFIETSSNYSSSSIRKTNATKNRYLSSRSNSTKSSNLTKAINKNFRNNNNNDDEDDDDEIDDDDDDDDDDNNDDESDDEDSDYSISNGKNKIKDNLKFKSLSRLNSYSNLKRPQIHPNPVTNKIASSSKSSIQSVNKISTTNNISNNVNNLKSFNEEQKPNFQKYYFQSTLITANSKPFLIKKSSDIISDLNKLTITSNNKEGNEVRT